MIQTTTFRPTGILKDYIQSFEPREFDTFNEVMKKPSHAFHEARLSLFIDCKKPLFESVDNSYPSYIYNASTAPFAGVMGIQSAMSGSFVFQGRYRIFNIQFRPIGFSSIFQIPSILIKDEFIEAGDLFDQEIKGFHEQLHEAKNMHEMVVLAEKFLEDKLTANRNLWKNDCLQKASDFLINEPNAYSIERLAYHSNMTVKTFERKFTGLVGIPPKLYARIRRFNMALETKQYYPELSYLDVCVQTGYFDLMHLHRDFKAFGGLPPRAFFDKTPPVFENFLPM